MRLNVKQIAQYTGGRFLIEAIDPSEILFGITWDSRTVFDGCLFVALPGEKVDGHKFVMDAISNGARAVLVSEAPEAKACRLAHEFGIGIIEVPNTYHAISDLARGWRSHLKGCVIGLTGSVGKTTTKNLIHDVLRSKFSTVATIGNQNNELGVPNTILAADPDTQMIVVEMGMRGLGQIADLCGICRPDWGAVTKIDKTHMELLGSQDAIIQAKSELFEALPMGRGRAFVNEDDPFSEKLQLQAHLKERDIDVIAFNGGDPAKEASASVQDGDPSGARVWAEDISINPEGCPEFVLCAQGFNAPVELAPTLFDMQPDVQRVGCKLTLRGEHNVANACCAAAVGLSAGISIEDVACALGQATCEVGRQEIIVARDGFRVINDSYNAGPESMRASLKMFSSMEVEGRRYLVLGDMGELGDIAVECHRAVGRIAGELGFDNLICIGELSRHIAEGAREAGMQDANIVEVDTIGEVLGQLEGVLEPQDAVLVKASHFMELGRVVEGLVS